MRARQFAVTIAAAAVMGVFGSALAQTVSVDANVSPGVSDTNSSSSLPSASCTCPDQTNAEGKVGDTSVSGSVNTPSVSCNCPGNSASGSSAAGGSASSSSSTGGSAAAGAGSDPESSMHNDKAEQSR